MSGHYGFALVILATGALMLFVFWRSLKDGYVNVDWWPPRIHRAKNPIGYWLWQAMIALAGFLLIGVGLSGLIFH